jgi:hypothetical protein
MGYSDPFRAAATDAGRDLLEAAIVLGGHLDAPEHDVDDETIARALSAFMDARECYLASLSARYGVACDSGPPSAHSHHTVFDLVRRVGLSA